MLQGEQRLATLRINTVTEVPPIPNFEAPRRRGRKPGAAKPKSCPERKRVESDFQDLKFQAGGSQKFNADGFAIGTWTREEVKKFLHCYDTEPDGSRDLDKDSRWKSFSKRMYTEFGVRRSSEQCHSQVTR